MKYISKEIVKKELGAVPGKLDHDFYVKEVDGNETIYRPIESRDFIKETQNPK